MKNKTATVGENVTITCTVEGFPAPNIKIFHNGKNSLMLEWKTSSQWKLMMVDIMSATQITVLEMRLKIIISLWKVIKLCLKENFTLRFCFTGKNT